MFAICSADGVVFYRIEDSARAAYQVQSLEQAIVNLTTTNLRSVIGSIDLDDVLSKRAEINEIADGDHRRGDESRGVPRSCASRFATCACPTTSRRR
jgi:hypothetical protein